MSMAERSPSPLMFTKQYSDSEQSPSSSLTVPTVTMSSYPSPQVKRKFTEGMCVCALADIMHISV